MKNKIDTEELAQAARAAYFDDQWNEFWSEFEAAAQGREDKNKALAEPRNLNTIY
jgi:hypothetical protein